MDKKYILIILLVVILLAIGVTFYSGSFNQNKISVGNAEFTIPDGYHKGVNNQLNDLNLTNGYNSIFFAKYDGEDVESSVDEMSAFIKNQNQTPYLTNFTVDNVLVHKLTIINNTQYYRYWFVDNGVTYCIYTWDGNANTDNLVTDLIKSINQK